MRFFERIKQGLAKIKTGLTVDIAEGHMPEQPQPGGPVPTVKESPPVGPGGTVLEKEAENGKTDLPGA